VKTYNLLSVKINSVSVGEILNFCESVIASQKKAQICTVNNEFIVEAQKNNEFKDALNNSSLSIADSVGVVKAIKSLYRDSIERIPGADLFWDLCKLSRDNHYRIYLIGGKAGVGQRAKVNIQKRFKGIHIVGHIDGVDILPHRVNNEITSEINKSKAQIVFVGLGAPKQELWIERNLDKINANIFIGVGGTLDFVSGRIKRAPKFMRKLGLEWLFRLIAEPSRYRRIYKATIIFSALVRQQAHKGQNNPS